MKKWLAAGVLMASLFALTGCGQEKHTQEVNVGYFNNVTHPQALLMKANGSLEERFGEEVTVKWTAFNAGPAEVEALFAGDIDIGYIGPVPALTANVKSDGDVVILSGATKGGAVLVKRDGVDINSVEDLAGKTVAIPQIGNTQHLNLLELLEKNNLKPDTEGGSVRISAVANADVANMMERGDIDAALVPEPWGATLLGQGAGLVLDYDEVYMNGDYDVAVVVARKEFVEENPELVEAFLAEHEAATAQMNEQKKDSLKIINEELETATGKSLNEDILNDAFERIGVSTELNRDSIRGFAEIGKSQGIIKEVPADDKLYIAD